jgi:hypothetical protein
MPIYVPGKVVLAQTYVGLDDPDAAAYITAVETADGQSLETAVKVAIHSFVKGCKNDGIWPAIKASCILAGARTLQGALVPLVGAAPTSFNFVAGDYNRETGLTGNGSSKYLNSNRAVNADPASNCHLSVFMSARSSVTVSTLIGTVSGRTRIIVGTNANDLIISASVAANTTVSGANSTGTGFLGIRRNSAANFQSRLGGIDASYTSAIGTQGTTNIGVFYDPNLSDNYSNGTCAFYSIGESLDLSKLDARVTALINAFGAAIP